MARRTVPDDTVDGLKRRLRDLERGLADEKRVRHPPPEYVEPKVSGGAAEHFRYIVPDYRTTATSAVQETVALSGAANGAFASSGVSLAANIITLPVGKWLLGITVETTWWSGQPTYGDFHMGFDVFNPHHPYLASLRYPEYAWTGSAPTFSGSNLYNITASDQTVKVIHYTDSGVTSTLYGMVWGIQVA